MDSPRVAVIGAGPMGLAAAYGSPSAEGGHVLRARRPHRRHVGPSTSPARASSATTTSSASPTTHLRLSARVRPRDRLRWVDTKMGFYYDGRLYDWGHPFALLRFPGLSLVDKARYALHVMRAKRVSDWRRTTRSPRPSGCSGRSARAPTTSCGAASSTTSSTSQDSCRRPGSARASSASRCRAAACSRSASATSKAAPRCCSTPSPSALTRSSAARSNCAPASRRS